MKKFIISVLAFTAMTIPSLAQEKALKQNGFWDNWFIQAQAGASYTFSEGNRDASIGDLITPSFAISGGKHLSPLFGLRAQVGGWKARSQYGQMDDTYGYKYYRGTIDGLLNVTNLFSTYNPDSKFNLYGYLGISAIHTSHKDVYVNTDKKLSKANMIVPRVGIQADYLIASNVSLNLDVSGNLLEDRFNGRIEGKAYDGMLTAMAGVTYHFNKTGFDLVSTLDQSEIDRLNDMINQQRSSLSGKDKTITDLQAALAKKPEVVKETLAPIEETVMNSLVVFKLGKSALPANDNQEINIYNAAKYFQDNPDMDLIITGHADKSTGNATINQKLSEQRAEAVAKILIDKYGISPSRIKTEGHGDKEELFSKPEWNRVATFTAVPRK